MQRLTRRISGIAKSAPKVTCDRSPRGGEGTTDAPAAPRETQVVEMLTLDVADLVVAFFIVYGAVVAAVVYGFLRAVASGQRTSRVASRT